MKKKLGIIIGAVAGSVILGSGVYYTNADEVNPKLDSEKIRSMVQEQYDGTITEFELDKDQNKAVYEVEVQNSNTEYDLKLDGDTGEVLHESKKEIKQDRTKEDHDDDVALENMDKKNAISVEEAKKIANKQFDGDVISVELDKDDNQLIYEVELRNGKKEADFEINAETGDILEQDIETEAYDD